MKMKNILIVLLVLAAIGGFIGWRMWNKAPEKVENEKGTAVTAAALCSSFAADETAANAEYLNKTLEVTGTATLQEQNQDGKTVITLGGGSEGESVLCTMRDKGASAATGKTVTIKGRCSGNDMFGVLLTDCILLNR